MPQFDEEVLSSLLKRLERVEDLVDEVHNSQGDSRAVDALEFDVAYAEGERECPQTAVMARWKSFTWSTSTLMAMRTLSSKITLYSTGAVETVCVMEDESRHRKYANSVSFSIKAKSTGAVIGSLSSWSGNFSPGERKTYTSGGTYGSVRDNFDEIGSASNKPFIPSRYWYARERN